MGKKFHNFVLDSGRGFKQNDKTNCLHEHFQGIQGWWRGSGGIYTLIHWGSMSHKCVGHEEYVE